MNSRIGAMLAPDVVARRRDAKAACRSGVAWLTLLIATMSSTAPSAQAQSAAPATFPTQPVHFVLPYSVGSGPDSVVRQIAEKMGQQPGFKGITENKPGANGWLAVSDVKRAPADGYRLLVVDNTHMTLQGHLYKDLPFNPERDFVPVAPVYTTYFFVAVAADSPWKNMEDLIRAARESSKPLTYGTWGMGSVAHIGAAMLESQTGTHMTHVPYKELPQLYSAVANGDVSWAFGSAATAGPLYAANKLRFLAVAAPTRVLGYDDIPTVAESGGPANFELRTWVAIYAPKGTPPNAIDALNRGVQNALSQADVQRSLTTFGFQPWSGLPGVLALAARTDTQAYADVVQRSNIKIE